MTTSPTEAEAALPAAFAPHFEGLRQGEIRFPACRACGHVEWYPMARCSRCQAEAFDWKPVHGPARLWSWTVVRRDFSPGKGPRPPFVVGLVTFDELPGTRLITNIVDCREEDLAIDAPVEPVFADPAAPTPSVTFRLATGLDGRAGG